MKAKPPFLCLKPGFDLALGKVLLTGVGTAPSSNLIKISHYKNFSVKISEKIPEENVTQGTLCSDMVSESLSEPRKSRKDIIHTYSEPSRCFLTVSIAPFVESSNNYCIFKLFVKVLKEVIQGALTSRPASTVFSAKLRHGLAWHPSSLFVIDASVYKLFAQK